MADPIDFNSFLAGDLTYQQALGAIEDARRADEAQRNAAVYQGLINYGELPQAPAGTSQSVTDFLNSIPQSVKDAVGLNTTAGLSQLAQRLQTQRDAQSLMRGNLGERGIIRSGDYAYLTNKNARAEQLARATDLQNLMGGFNTTWSNYLSQLDALRGEQGSASQSAWQRMMDAINAKAAADAAAQAAADNKALLDALSKQNQPAPVDTTPTPGPFDLPGPTPDPGGPFSDWQDITYGGKDVGQILNTTPAERALVDSSPNALRTIGSDAAQGPVIPDIPYYPGVTSTIPDTQGSTQTTFSPEAQQSISADPNFLQYQPSDAASMYQDYSQPDYSQPDYSQPVSDYLQSQPSDAASYASEQYAAPAPVYQQPAGYGGTATKYQVQRNML